MRLRKKSSRRGEQKLNTSALPDIIFMILFFFMTIGMIPAPRPQIDAIVPVLEGGEELDETKHYIHMYIGSLDGELVAQIGYDTITGLDGITEALKAIREDDPLRNIVVLRIDSKTGMGYLRNEIEPAILDAGIRKVKYQLEDEDIRE